MIASHPTVCRHSQHGEHLISEIALCLHARVGNLPKSPACNQRYDRIKREIQIHEGGVDEHTKQLFSALCLIDLAKCDEILPSFIMLR